MLNNITIEVTTCKHIKTTQFTDVMLKISDPLVPEIY